MRIVVLDGYTLNPGDNPWDGIAALGELQVYDRTPDDLIVSRAAEAEIILTNKTPLSAETIAALPKLRYISVLATGHDGVNTAAAKERGIPVSNVPTYGTQSVAQHTITLLLELCHRVGLHDSSVKAGDWSQIEDFCYWKTPLVELNGKKLGVIGYGRIGQCVANMARAFGMEILYYKRTDREASDARGVSLNELAAESDAIALHCALKPETVRFVNKQFLAKMKKTAFLINTGRGALIDENDLAEALHAGTIGGAALDVLTKEPPLPDHPLFSAPNCIITPHMAWTGRSARETLMRITEGNVRGFLEGKLVHVVNS